MIGSRESVMIDAPGMTAAARLRRWWLIPLVLVLAGLLVGWWRQCRWEPPLPTRQERMAWLSGHYHGIEWAAVWIKVGTRALATHAGALQHTAHGQRGTLVNVSAFAKSRLDARHPWVQYAAAINGQFFTMAVGLPIGCTGTGTPGQWYTNFDGLKQGRWAFGFDAAGRFRLDRITPRNNGRAIRLTFPYGMAGVGCLGTNGRYHALVRGEDIYSYTGNDWVNEARNGVDSGSTSSRARTLVAWTVRPESPTLIADIFLIVCRERYKGRQLYHGWSWAEAQHFCFDRVGGLHGRTLIEAIVDRTDEDAAVKRTLATSGIHTALMLDGGGMAQLHFYKTDARGTVLSGYPKSLTNGSGQVLVPSWISAHALAR